MRAQNIELVKKAALTLINCKDDFYYMKQSVDNLYEIFKAITGVDINDLNHGEIMLPSGKAISPSAAAHCLLEMKRTAIFLRGIKKAIDTKMKNNNVVNILYAGCGSYATLITPLLTMYNSDGLRITLLDINQTSLNAVKRLLKELGLDNFTNKYVLDDASLYKITKEYDIVISETMQSCLENEPQVAIMQNLIPQMNKDATFIPQQIHIDGYLKNPGKWDEKKLCRTGVKSMFLDKLFFIDKSNLNIDTCKKIIDIPSKLNGYIELMLHTTIIVFEDEILNVNDCSLNLPKKFYEFREQYAKSIEFSYLLKPYPKIDCKVVDFA